MNESDRNRIFAMEMALARLDRKIDALGWLLMNVEQLPLPLIPPNPTGKEGDTIPE